MIATAADSLAILQNIRIRVTIEVRYPRMALKTSALRRNLDPNEFHSLLYLMTHAAEMGTPVYEIQHRAVGRCEYGQITDPQMIALELAEFIPELAPITKFFSRATGERILVLEIYDVEVA